MLRRMFKNALRKLGVFEPIRRRIDLVRSYRRLPGGSTVFVHVGKCGGKSVRRALAETDQYENVVATHVKAPVWRKDLKYLVVARDPVSRLVSAYNWRYKLVVTDGTKRAGNEDEYRVLVKYSGLNELAESLYEADGSLDRVVERDLLKIGHVRRGFAYYLSDVLRKGDPTQISAVLMQETLGEDIHRVFGLKSDRRENYNPHNPGKKELSEAATANLKRWLSPDYEILTKLYCWGKIKASTFALAIAGEPGESVED